MGLQHLQQFAKGCFLPEMTVATPHGAERIDSLKPGDTVISYNEATGGQQESKIGDIDVLQRTSYYSLNNGRIRATGDHPFYTREDGIVKVKDLKIGHTLVDIDDGDVKVEKIDYTEKDVTVYNLLDVVPNNNYYVEDLLVHNKGCFLAGTPIKTPYGAKYVEDFLPGDKVTSFNETTKKEETSTVERLDVLAAREYYNINYSVNATGEHPFYTKDGVKEVKNLKLGDVLITEAGEEVVRNINVYKRDVVIYNLINVEPNHNYFAANYLVHNKGCFLPDTLIKTPDGDVEIQNIKPGQTIYSFDEDAQEMVPASVEKVVILKVRGYYVINDKLQVTATHPMYTPDGIKAVSTLDVGDYLVNELGEPEIIESINHYDVDVVVYNLINVHPNHNYFADGYLAHNKGGGGCFLAGTQITMRSGNVNIEDIKAGDKIWTLNETARITELATVGELQELDDSGYYIINSELKATAAHPFYTSKGIKTVAELKIGDTLYKGFDNKKLVKTIEYIDEPVKVYNLLNVSPNHNYLANGYLVHNKGGSAGGGGKGGSSSSVSSGKSSSSSSKSSSSSSTPAAPKPGTSTAKPGAKVKTSAGKEVTSSTKAPANKQYKSSNGIVGDNGYTPRYSNGYVPPAGSVVYHRDRDFVDYLPWIYLFSQDSPANDKQVIVQPDGKEVQAQPVQEGVDGMAVFNWILLILMIIGIIGGVVWGVNKYASRNDPPKKKSYAGYY